MDTEEPSKHSRSCSPFVEGSSSSVGDEVATTSKKPRHSLQKKEKPPKDNFGSEESEDSEEDEAGLPLIPRVYRATMETPEDAPGIEAPPRQLLQPPYEPGAFLDFKWSSFPNPPSSNLRRESFSHSIGPTAAYTDPYDIFINIWDRQFMEHIVVETNKYAQLLAQQLFLNNKLGPMSRISDWKDTTVDELYVFFALTIAMGIVAKGRLVEYWNANSKIFITPGFRVHMSLRRYQLLWQCLHFSDNKDISTEHLSVSEAKLFKIQPVLDHLNSRFQSMYNLQQNIALDESLLPWKGWLDSNQCFPNKAAEAGIRTYEVCEPETGYLWRFAVHAYKRTKNAVPNSDPLEAYVPSLVLKLLRGLENRGHTVWMDNFYNSPALARKLKSLGFDCVGTLRTNRQYVPQELASLTKANMRPGEIVGFTSGDVDVMVWRGRNRVGMISTYHEDAITQSKGVTKPALIHDYGQMMAAVDKKDKILAGFPVERKRSRIWYKKLFRRLLNVSVLNAYIISKKCNSISEECFRATLTESLLSRHSAVAPPAVLSQTPRMNEFFSASKHYLVEYEFLPHVSNKARTRRVCVACKKRICTYCAGCDKTVCIGDCFKAIHE